MSAKVQAVPFRFTAPVIGAYPTLFTARRFRDARGVESNDARFSMNFLILPSHPDVAALNAAMQQAVAVARAAGLFGDEAIGTWATQSGSAYADAANTDGQDKRRAFRPYLILRTQTGEKYPPALACPINGQLANLPRDITRSQYEHRFFGGMECYAEVGFKAYKVGNNPPVVSAYLQMVAATGRGDHVPAFNAGTKDASALLPHGATVVGAYSDVNPVPGSNVVAINRSLDGPPTV